MALGDLDGDGDLDVAVAGNSCPIRLQILENVGGGQLAVLQTVAFDGAYAHDLDLGDLDGDGDLDVVIVSALTDESVLFANDGQGTMSQQLVLRDGLLPLSVTIADMDGDRLPDVVTMNFDSGDASVWRNAGGGLFPAAQRFPALAGPRALEAVDVNGDGGLDLVTVSLLRDFFVVLPGACGGRGTRRVGGFVLRSLSSTDSAMGAPR